jgi:hypothetical protein
MKPLHAMLVSDFVQALRVRIARANIIDIGMFLINGNETAAKIQADNTDADFFSTCHGSVLEIVGVAV